MIKREWQGVRESHSLLTALALSLPHHLSPSLRSNCSISSTVRRRGPRAGPCRCRAHPQGATPPLIEERRSRRPHRRRTATQPPSCLTTPPRSDPARPPCITNPSAEARGRSGETAAAVQPHVRWYALRLSCCPALLLSSLPFFFLLLFPTQIWFDSSSPCTTFSRKKWLPIGIRIGIWLSSAWDCLRIFEFDF